LGILSSSVIAERNYPQFLEYCGEPLGIISKKIVVAVQSKLSQLDPAEYTWYQNEL